MTGNEFMNIAFVFVVMICFALLAMVPENDYLKKENKKLREENRELRNRLEKKGEVDA